jgi:hypothetical protein
MKSKNIFILFVCSLMAVAIFSCEEKIDRSFKSPTVVEFKNYYLERQTFLGAANMAAAYPYIVTTENVGLSSISVRQSVTPYQDQILVQIVGPLSDSDITIEYEIDPSSTAVSGTNYSITGGTLGTIVIPKGQLSGNIELTILNGLIAPTPTRVALIINLKQSGSIAPSQNYKTFTYNILK